LRERAMPGKVEDVDREKDPGFSGADAEIGLARLFGPTRVTPSLQQHSTATNRHEDGDWLHKEDMRFPHRNETG
jgi:hypothetical protein